MLKGIRILIAYDIKDQTHIHMLTFLSGAKLVHDTSTFGACKESEQYSPLRVELTSILPEIVSQFP